MARKKRISPQEAKNLLPIVKEFNKLSKGFLKLLGQKIAHKEKKIAHIAVMVRGISRPTNPHHNSINIKTVDLDRAMIRKFGLSSGQPMSWEDDLRKKRRGLIL